MENPEDLYEWEHNLKTELDGLQFCRDKVRGDREIPETVKEKFLSVIGNLKRSVSALIQQCIKLRSSTLTPHLMNVKMKQLKEEYLDTFKKLSDLLATVDGPLESPQRHQQSTYTSRQMSRHWKKSLSDRNESTS